MANNINQITSTVLIDEILDSSGSDFARAIMTGFLYSDKMEAKDKSAKIVFSENNEARRTRGVKQGDILFIYGTLGYTVEDQIIVYATSFIVLSKNNNNLTTDERKIIFSSYGNLPNQVFLEGVVTNNIKSSKKCLIDIHRGKYIRGEIKERDVIPCIYANEPTIKNEDSVFITGYIKDNKIYGTVKKIS